MNAQLATLVYAIGIAGLFWLDRERDLRPSKALWIPVIWLLINESRSVSDWLNSGPTISQSASYLEGSPLDAVIFGLLMAGGVLVLIYRRKQIGPILLANWPILLFFTYCALSSSWSDYPFVSLKRCFKATGDVVMVLVVLTDPNTYSAIKRLMSRTAFLLIPLSILLIKYYPDFGRSYNPWDGVSNYGGVTTFKNLLGMTCLICGLGCLWIFTDVLREKKGLQRAKRIVAYGTVLAMVGWLFWMANSATSFSCFIMAGALIIITAVIPFTRKPIFVHLFVIGIVCVSLFALFGDTGGNLVGTLGRDATLTGRTQVWSVVLSLVQNPVLGTGFESFWLGDRLPKIWVALNQKGIQEAHNGYLEVYLNLGWVGVTLLGLLVIKGYRNMISSIRHDPNVGRIKLAFFVVGLVYSLTEAGFRMMTPVWFAFLLATIAVPYTAAPESQPAWILAQNDFKKPAELDSRVPVYGKVI
jgi:exopolysaccharide production protein ExoQ